MADSVRLFFDRFDIAVFEALEGRSVGMCEKFRIHNFAVPQKCPFHLRKNPVFILIFQTVEITDDDEFVAAAGISDIDPVGIIRKTDSGTGVASDVTDDDRIAFPALKTVNG